jgi:hypothetical protein
MVIVIYAKKNFFCANRCAENEINGQIDIAPDNISYMF